MPDSAGLDLANLKSLRKIKKKLEGLDLKKSLCYNVRDLYLFAAKINNFVTNHIRMYYAFG